MIRRRPLLIGVAAWSVGAVASIGVGLLALSLVEENFANQSNPPSLVADPVGQDGEPPTSGQPVPTSRSSPTAHPAPNGSGVDRLLNTAGGNVVARCQGAQAYLVYWTPAQGYRIHDLVRGPAEAAKLKFEGPGGEFELQIKCADGVPRAKIENEHEEGR